MANSPVIQPSRREFLPSPTLPLIYFAGAHASLAIALAVLVVRPDVPGPFVYHPRALALVHLITLGWITGSILGALYITAPLAFGVPLRSNAVDTWVCVSFWLATLGMVSGFWTGHFAIVGGAAIFVVAPLITIGIRLARGLRASRMPAGVSLHVVLAFVNIVIAGTAGLILALNRPIGSLPWSPMSLAAAHAHLAVLGWATMMILGVAYRLIPMFVPAAMPMGSGLATSAVLLEIGTLGVSGALALDATPVPWMMFVLGALVSFFVQVRRIVRQRRPRPADLPRYDWSTWQTHAALLYLLISAGIGVRLAIGGGSLPLIWAYGVTGLLGFVAQMVVGIAGRLLPMYVWYRSLERADGAPPDRSVHRLIAPSLSLAVLVCWQLGLPALTIGLMTGQLVTIACGALTLLAATALNTLHGAVLVRRAHLRLHRSESS